MDIINISNQPDVEVVYNSGRIKFFTIPQMLEYFEEKEYDITEEELHNSIDELIDIGYLENHLLDSEDRILKAKDNLTWPDFNDIDHQLKKEILLLMVENPKALFILQKTQSGKTKICANMIKSASENKNIKNVTLFISLNDKALISQSSDGIQNVCDSNKVKIFVLSSDSKIEFETIKIYIDAWAMDITGDYKMPVIIALANQVQSKKLLALIEHIDNRVIEFNYPLRIQPIIDEADSTYPIFRNTSIRKRDGSFYTFADYINSPTCKKSLHEIAFVTATEGEILDEAFPECANAHMHYIEMDENDKRNYRSMNSPDTKIKIVKHPVKMSNNIYAMGIIKQNLEYFKSDIPGTTEKRKVIVRSNIRRCDQVKIAKSLNDYGFVTMVFNMNGIILYQPGKAPIKYKIKRRRCSDILYFIYKYNKLENTPLFIIGNKKVDRGIGFHAIPRIMDPEAPYIEYDGERIAIDGIDGLIFSDMILGHVTDPYDATQKAGRLSGIIAQCPNYHGLTYWTDESTERKIKNHLIMVDSLKDMYGCSAIQAVTHAKENIPKEVNENDKYTRDISPPFTTQTENEIFAKEHGAKRATKYARDENGFAKCSTETNCVQTLENIIKLAETGNKGSNMPQPLKNLKVGEYMCRRYVCYEDITDVTTERYLTIWVRRDIE